MQLNINFEAKITILLFWAIKALSINALLFYLSSFDEITLIWLFVFLIKKQH